MLGNIIKIDLKDGTGIELRISLGFEVHATSTGVYIIYRYNVSKTSQIAYIPYKAILNFKVVEEVYE